MADRIIAKRYVVAIRNYRLVALRNGERNEVVRLAIERRGHRAGNSGDHAVKIRLSNRNFARARIADAIWRLCNRIALHDFRGTACDRGGGLRHASYCSVTPGPNNSSCSV